MRTRRSHADTAPSQARGLSCGLREPPRTFRAWLVVANPARYEWDRAFEEDMVEWSSAAGRVAQRAIREAMREGDRVFGYRSAPYRDLYCELAVAGPPHRTPEGTDAIEFRPVRRLRQPVPLALLKADPGLADMPFLRQPQLSICGLTEAHVTRISHLIAGMGGEDAPQPGDLVGRLLAAQTDTSAPARFEGLVAEALRVLGMEARRLGGAGRADVVAEMRVGRGSFAAVVDAKTTGARIVRLGQVDFHSIEEHRQASSADHAAVVGPRFSGGKLVTRAVERGVALVRTEWLVALLRRHAQWPLTPEDLRSVFACRGLAERAVARLEEAFLRQKSLAQLAATVLELFDQHQLREETSEPLSAREVRAFLRERARHEGAPGPASREVESVIEFLASPVVRVLARQDEGYVLCLPPAPARQRLAAIERWMAEEASRR